MRVSQVLLLSSLLVATTEALCAGDKPCSGHGQCTANDLCSCDRGWFENDCSARKCPYRKAFADVADTSVSGRTVHYYAECSNKGVCDRKSGECDCFDGYTGAGCDRLMCPNDCSGNGQCTTLSAVNTYTGWDADKIMVCKCDPGFTGPDCASRMCPKGDDPLTVVDSSNNVQVNEVQKLMIDGGGNAITAGQFVLQYTDMFGESYKTWPLTVTTATAISVKEALQALPNSAIPSVTVTQTGLASTNNVYWLVTFTDPMNSGDQNQITIDSTQCNVDGCQPVIDTALTSAGTITVTASTTTAGTEENIECSNRGLCDIETGICKCSAGYTGQACHLQTVAT